MKPKNNCKNKLISKYSNILTISIIKFALYLLREMPVYSVLDKKNQVLAEKTTLIISWSRIPDGLVISKKQDTVLLT
jgi:hypothetical protein